MCQQTNLLSLFFPSLGSFFVTMPASGTTTPALPTEEDGVCPRQEYMYAAAKRAARTGHVNADGVIDPEAIAVALERVLQERATAPPSPAP